MNRPARHLLTLLALLFGTLLLALGWLLATESGLQFLWRALAAQAGPELAATQVTGRLAGRLHIQTLSYKTDTFSVAVEQLEIAWQPGALLTGTLRFSEISAGAVHYVQLAGDTGSGDRAGRTTRCRTPLAPASGCTAHRHCDHRQRTG